MKPWGQLVRFDPYFDCAAEPLCESRRIDPAGRDLGLLEPLGAVAAVKQLGHIDEIEDISPA